MMKYDKFDLTGKVALCAGGSSGLGYQFARAMGFRRCGRGHRGPAGGPPAGECKGH